MTRCVSSEMLNSVHSMLPCLSSYALWMHVWCNGLQYRIIEINDKAEQEEG